LHRHQFVSQKRRAEPSTHNNKQLSLSATHAYLVFSSLAWHDCSGRRLGTRFKFIFAEQNIFCRTQLHRNKTCIAETIRTLDQLDKVYLPGRGLDDEDAAALADALKVNTSVTTIWLNANQIGDVSATALAEALQVNTSVTTIGLGGNHIGVDGATALADLLKGNTSVTTIHLGWNQIVNEGAAALVDVLKVNASVTKINFYNNQISNEGATALANALRVTTSVKTIYLHGNQIGDEGATALADALKVNTSLLDVSLFANAAINESILTTVKELIDRNKRLRHLFLFDARKMLLSVMCADECGVVWPYLLGRGNTDGVAVPDDIDALRATFASIVVARQLQQ
jgi:hypothetical protein